jgi:hypothetical protein
VSVPGVKTFDGPYLRYAGSKRWARIRVTSQVWENGIVILPDQVPKARSVVDNQTVTAGLFRTVYRRMLPPQKIQVTRTNLAAIRRASSSADLPRKCSFVLCVTSGINP